MTHPFIEAFFDEPTNTISYLVGDPATRAAAVIDPVLDFDLASGEADTRWAERILAFAAENDWQIAMVLETHAHADHLSAAPFIKARTGAWIGIGAHIRDVQKTVDSAEVHEASVVRDILHDTWHHHLGLQVLKGLSLQVRALLLEQRTSTEHDVSALLVELDDLELVGLADEFLKVAHRAEVNL